MKTSTKPTTIIRWTARILATLIAGFVLFMFVGESIQSSGQNHFKWVSTEGLRLSFFFVTCLGLLLSWKWEKTGAFTTFIGLILFTIITVYIQPNEFIKTVQLLSIIWIAGIPAALFIVCWWRDRSKL